MTCWICGGESESGDHFIKASDVRGLFGKEISTKKPIYLHFNKGKGIKLQSSKSNHLKSKTRLCKECNTSRVANYDLAWSKTLNYVNQLDLFSRGNFKIRFSKIFGDLKITSGTHLHLYFVKLFGSAICDYEIPIDLKEFSISILQGKPLPGLYLSFYKWGPRKYVREIHLSEIHSYKLNNTDHDFWQWMYSVGHFAVEVDYIPTMPEIYLKSADENYHPDSSRNRYIVISDVATPSTEKYL